MGERRFKYVKRMRARARASRPNAIFGKSINGALSNKFMHKVSAPLCRLAIGGYYLRSLIHNPQLFVDIAVSQVKNAGFIIDRHDKFVTSLKRNTALRDAVLGLLKLKSPWKRV
jgi:hypothetical protein